MNKPFYIATKVGLCLALVLAILLAGCGPAATPVVAPVPTPKAGGPVQPVVGMPQGSAGFKWWNDTVFYEIFVRSFYDSDGDGIGDFNGIIEKLDYLNDGDPATTTDLGITGIWLLPIFASPSYHGYDATDFYAINPEYGTLDDFKRLLDEAHQRGIRVIIDLMLNHTSTEHPWFQAALDPASPYRDWYIWSETDPRTIGPWGQDVWHEGPQGGYFYGVFWSGMPDLNFNNPEVTAEMQSVTRYWLEDVKVDGLRLDAIRYLIEDGTEQADTEASHEWLRAYRTFYREINPNAMTVGEVWTTSQAVSQYVQGDQVDMAFDFDLASAFINAVRSGRSAGLKGQLRLDQQYFPAGSAGLFLTNHDQDRVMSVLGKNVERAKTAASLMLTAPGVPFLYYGEEIGMLGQKPDEKIRKPMQWSAEAQAGFSSGAPWQTPDPDYAEKNVAAQLEAEDSLLAHYRALIRLRNEHIALRVGETFAVNGDVPAVYALLRSHAEEDVLVIINLGKDPLDGYSLTLESGPLSGAYQALPLLGEGEFAPLEADAAGGFAAYQPGVPLPANGIVVLRLRR